MGRGLPDGRAGRARPLPARARAPLRAGHSISAVPVSAGVLHGALRLPRLRRRPWRRGVDRRGDRDRERAVPVLPGKDIVSHAVALPFWVPPIVFFFPPCALSAHPP